MNENEIFEKIKDRSSWEDPDLLRAIKTGMDKEKGKDETEQIFTKAVISVAVQSGLDAVTLIRKCQSLPEEKPRARTLTIGGKIVSEKEPKKKAVPKLTFVNAAQLSKADLPEIYYPIEGLIPEGESVLSAPPKSGKSWWVLDAGLSVSQGKPFLGFKTNKSDVVYFAMEDGEKFEQERLNRVCSNVPDNFHFVFEGVVPLDEGFIDQLEQTHEAFPNARFIVIDTLNFIASKQRKGESSYERDYRTGRLLKGFADKYGIAVLVVTHSTKLQHPEDPIANITGTNGVTGAADALLVIAKETRMSKDAVLVVEGRRVRQAAHEIEFNSDACVWKYNGVADPDERERKQRQKAIEELKQSTAYKAALMLADKHVEGWRGNARKLINDAAEFGVFVLESAKDVGGMLSNNIPTFARDGIRVEVIKNGTGANIYKLSAWEKVK